MDNFIYKLLCGYLKQTYRYSLPPPFNEKKNVQMTSTCTIHQRSFKRMSQGGYKTLLDITDELIKIHFYAFVLK